jgi:hypothetical protein
MNRNCCLSPFDGDRDASPSLAKIRLVRARLLFEIHSKAAPWKSTRRSIAPRAGKPQRWKSEHDCHLGDRLEREPGPVLGEANLLDTSTPETARRCTAAPSYWRSQNDNPDSLKLNAIRSAMADTCRAVPRPGILPRKLSRRRHFSSTSWSLARVTSSCFRDLGIDRLVPHRQRCR